MASLSCEAFRLLNVPCDRNTTGAQQASAFLDAYWAELFESSEVRYGAVAPVAHASAGAARGGVGARKRLCQRRPARGGRGQDRLRVVLQGASGARRAKCRRRQWRRPRAGGRCAGGRASRVGACAAACSLLPAVGQRASRGIPGRSTRTRRVASAFWTCWRSGARRGGGAEPPLIWLRRFRPQSGPSALAAALEAGAGTVRASEQSTAVRSARSRLLFRVCLLSSRKPSARCAAAAQRPAERRTTLLTVSAQVAAAQAARTAAVRAQEKAKVPEPIFSTAPER
jgi:hypothetical protein